MERENSAGSYGVNIPQYNPPTKYVSEKGDDNMYPFTNLGFTPGDIQDRYQGVLEPLSLFAPFPHEDGLNIEVKQEEPIEETVELERPVTPINDEIKAPPPHFNKLAKLVRRRISAKPEVEHLGMEDQKELAGIIMGEVNGIWPDYRMQVDDPFLSAEMNRELQRRITVHIVTVCERLFNHYLEKAQILNRRGVFSGPANMSRLKAQLALDANKFLNVLTIRRYIVSDLRESLQAGETDSDDEFYAKKPELPEQKPPKLSNKAFLEASRPKSKTQRKRYTGTDENIKELQSKMPGLDTSKLYSIIDDLPQERLPSRSSDEEIRADHASLETFEDLDSPHFITRSKLIGKKSGSVPNLTLGETLLEELGIQDGRESVLSLQDEAENFITEKQTVEAKETPRKQPGTREYAEQDLQRLISRPESERDRVEEDLPPLLQALTRSAKHDGKQAWIDQQLEQMEKNEQERREQEKIVIREPTHPQPATLSTKLTNKMIVRTSDTRVSERVCQSSITLKKNATVYNDLIDEIDPVTVKKLDSNLFLGDEITEVYKEIMKTVPTDHLDMENDILIEPSADAVNLSQALSSSTLNKPRGERIINNRLQINDDAPWREQPHREWAKTPQDPPKDIRGRPLVMPMTPKGEDVALREFLGPVADQFIAPPEDTGKMGEVMARSYASWLTWWKNTINSDDYMKYLSTQESDYMGVIFHFYNSDDEDDDEEGQTTRSKSVKKAAKQKAIDERDKKIASLKAEKTDFKEGFWNAQSVLMGGLGKDPTIIEEDAVSTEKTAPHSETPIAKTPRQRSMIISKTSTKKSLTVDNDESGASTYRGKTRDSETAMSKRSKSVTATEMSPRSRDQPKEPTPQERLEKIWSTLKMPDTQRLDMAIKYSTDPHNAKLDDAIEEWELAARMIIQREGLMAKLENFERLASDPNRFFEKGYRGSSVARLEEAKIRSSYYKKLELLEKQLQKILDDIKKEYQDQVQYMGRIYEDKMQWDRTEMLYWLQEERKQQALDYESRMKNLPQMQVKMATLEPITPSHVSVK